MTYQNARSGPNNVGEYQTSGLPWTTASLVTATPVKIDFPYVTNFVSVHGGAYGGTDGVRIGFSVNGINNGNYTLVKASDGWTTFNIRCRELYVRSDVGTVSMSLMVGLTLIENKAFPSLTGSATYNPAATASNMYGYGKPGDPGAGTGTG